MENIFAALESRKEEIITRNNASARFPYSTYLKGWELIDIAHSKPWFKERRILLDDTCGTWPSIIGKQREVLVLFCRGVSDLIRPPADDLFCQTWRSVPKGRSYLAATVACITNLDIHCRLDNRFRACTFNHKNCPSRLQELDHRPSSRAFPIPAAGAVIVGRTHHSLYQACLPDSSQLLDTTRKLGIEQDSAQEKLKAVAVEDSILTLPLPESKDNSEDICSTSTDDKNVRIARNTRKGEQEMNAY